MLYMGFREKGSPVSAPSFAGRSWDFDGSRSQHKRKKRFA